MAMDGSTCTARDGSASTTRDAARARRGAQREHDEGRSTSTTREQAERGARGGRAWGRQRGRATPPAEAENKLDTVPRERRSGIFILTWEGFTGDQEGQLSVLKAQPCTLFAGGQRHLIGVRTPQFFSHNNRFHALRTEQRLGRERVGGAPDHERPRAQLETRLLSRALGDRSACG